MIYVDCIGISVVEKGILRRYMHPPSGFPGLELLYIALHIRGFF